MITETTISSFADVETSHWAYEYIEVLYREGYVSGCTEDSSKYCPEKKLNRAESAVFILRGVNGADYTPPPASAQIFADVGPENWAAKWVNELFVRGYTKGCGFDQKLNLLNYCPNRNVTRVEACVFFMRVLKGKDYQPPDPKGIFNNLSKSWWGTKWIEAAFKSSLIPNHMYYTTYGLRFIGEEDELTRAEAAYMLYQATPPPHFNPETGPTNLPITNWGSTDRVERAAIVKRWLLRYRGSRWWSGVFPSELELAAWLLFEEGGPLLCKNEDKKHMVRAFRWRFRNGLTKEALSGFTAFINPNSGGSFNLDDWKELAELMVSGKKIDLTPSFSVVNSVYGENLELPLYLYWWDWNEMIDKYKKDPSQLPGSYYKTEVEGENPCPQGISFYFTGIPEVFFCATGQWQC